MLCVYHDAGLPETNMTHHRNAEVLLQRGLVPNVKRDGNNRRSL